MHRFPQKFELHTLFEHESLPYLQLGADAGAFLAAVEGINSRGAELLRLNRKSFSAAGYAGVLKAGNVCVQVLPKVDYPVQAAKALELPLPEREAQEWTASRNLLAMLGYAYDLPVQQLDSGMTRTTSGSWMEILIALFSDELYRQLLSGPDRQYVVRDDTLGFLRGKWRISDQLLRHPHQKHRFDLFLDELSEDTYLNRIFLFVCHQLLMVTADGANRRRLQAIIILLERVSRLERVQPGDLERVDFNRLNRRYEKAFAMARLFLQNQVLVLRAGRLQSFVFMLDMHVLFERFVFGFLKRHYRSIFPAGQGLHLLGQGKGRNDFAAVRELDQAGVFRLKPDILLLETGRVRLVLDTKYKRLESPQAGSGVSEGDVYQMAAYQSALKCGSGLLLYPSMTDRAVRDWYRYTGQAGSLLVSTINIHQPLHKPEELVKEMRALIQPLLAVSRNPEVIDAENSRS